MSTATGSMPDRFKTVVGQPYIIALKYKTGKVTRMGNVMYSLTSGLVAFFPPDVSAEIDSLRLDPGEPFQVCHHGRDRWTVERALPASAERSADVPREALPQQQMRPRSTTDTGTHASAPVPQLPQMPVNGAGLTSADIMARCYRQAIDIAVGAVSYAQENGLRITPEFANIQALAATICINESGRR